VLDSAPEQLSNFHAEWSSLPVRARARADGRMPAGATLGSSEQRKFSRFRCNGQAILQRQTDRLAALVVDISRSGVGIISPVQLFPCELVLLTTPQGRFPARVVSCVRLDAACYRCGCRFQRRTNDAEASPASSVGGAT
jgi:hypothetical protein